MTVQHLQSVIDVPKIVKRQPEDGLVPVRHGLFTLTATGLSWEGTPTIEEWAEVGNVLAVMERGIAFLVGDWVRFGEATYGAMASQFIDARGWRPKTVAVYRWMADSVPSENRMLDQGLDVGHHLAVAALTPAKQKTWLTKALGDGDGAHWTVARLKAALKHGGDSKTAETFSFHVICTSEKQMRRLMKLVELEGGVVKGRKADE